MFGPIKTIWRYIRDYKLRWILFVLGFGLGAGLDSFLYAYIFVCLWLLIIFIDTGERFYKGLKGMN